VSDECDVGIVPENAWPPIQTSANQTPCPNNTTKGSSNLSNIISSNNNEVKEFWQTGESDEEEEGSPVANGYVRVNNGDDFDRSIDEEEVKPIESSSHGGRQAAAATTITTTADTITVSTTTSDELEVLRAKVKSQEKEIDRLGSIRDEVENELQELTANLFQVFSTDSIVSLLGSY